MGGGGGRKKNRKIELLDESTVHRVKFPQNINSETKLLILNAERFLWNADVELSTGGKKKKNI